jgi:hypothetical protein
MSTPRDPRADSRDAARLLIQALPQPLPKNEAQRADAVLAGLLASGLLDNTGLGHSPSVAAAIRDGFTCLAHLLDEINPGHGDGQVVLLLLSDRYSFIYPAPDADQARARDTATALLDLARRHTDHPMLILGAALQAHAEESAATAP